MNIQETKTFYYAVLSAIVASFNFLATIITLVSFQSSYLNGENPNFWSLVLLISFFGILYLVLLAVQFFWVGSQQKYILSLAKHGHLQTLRMYVLLQDISSKRPHRRFAWMAKKMNRREYIARAAFHLLVENHADAAPDIVYCYELTINVGQPGEIMFEPLVFGDNHAKPQNCEIRLQYLGKDGNPPCEEERPVTPPEVHSIEDHELVVVDWYSDNTENRGIYYIRSVLSFQKCGTYKITLTYTRKKAFMIDDAEMFVIFPEALCNSLDRKIVEASFDITFCGFPEDQYAIADIAVLTKDKGNTSEYDHVFLHKVEDAQTAENPGKHLDEEGAVRKVQSSKVKIDARNVYILAGYGRNMIHRKVNDADMEKNEENDEQAADGAILATV